MNLGMNLDVAAGYKSKSQIARIITEHWVHANIFCPSCGNSSLDCLPNNSLVADFKCPSCAAEYELKSQKAKLIKRVVDGAFDSMISRINSNNSPHFFLMHYSSSLQVCNFFAIPSHYFIDDIIEKRRPLGPHARRAGWTGCNILIQNIPKAGKIFYVKNGRVELKSKVLRNWSTTLFIANQQKQSRGWTIQILRILDRIGKKEFSLKEVYEFEDELKEKFPLNNFIKDKIRQQLQLLRDQGYIEFRGQGHYLKK